MYTKDWVVDLMLDLVGYDEKADLGADTIVEPGCGDGAFLRRIVPRLVRSAETYGRPIRDLSAAIRAFELDTRVASIARESVVETLVAHGVSDKDSARLADSWVVEGDFLLGDVGDQVQWVVGNPPYVRVEETSADEYTKYRAKWKTMTGRADVYIGFYEAGLSLLKSGGQLCFICADRWMHNQYGAGLRKHIIDGFALRALIEVHDVDVFDVPVAAYPAVTLIQRAEHSSTSLATANSQFDDAGGQRLLRWLKSHDRSDCADESFSASLLSGQFKSDTSWPSGPPERLRLIADLEHRLPSLSEVGISVRVGLATGADRVYVVDDTGEIEPQFLKMAVGPADLKDGGILWSGRYLVSPWDGDSLVTLGQFPGLRDYFEKHREALKARYVAKKSPDAWWRTIDRPPADGYMQPKLLVADINDRIEPVLDESGHWPLHSAYYITSTDWDLESLGGYLISDIAGAFVEAYSVKMANGHLRVSGQYLKKIRIPSFSDLLPEQAEGLKSAFRNRDRALASTVVQGIVGRESMN
ncbi:hypothetical protein AVW09_00760 [Microbacterium sp. T32]|nr:hypothetical protein AVW09_00760 [Microbacterium sp. T32]